MDDAMLNLQREKGQSDEQDDCARSLSEAVWKKRAAGAGRNLSLQREFARHTGETVSPGRLPVTWPPTQSTTE